MLEAKPLPLANYFKPDVSFKSVKQNHALREDLPDQSSVVKVSGRIIGRRKASASLLFLDLESNGESL